MKSATLPSFWTEYRRLNEEIRQRARKTYGLWAENPFHPSLHFKCVNSEEGIWSVRVKSLGADGSIDYTKEGFTKGGKTYDITFDTVGKSLFSDCLRSLKQNGIYLRAVHINLFSILRRLSASSECKRCSNFYWNLRTSSTLIESKL